MFDMFALLEAPEVTAAPVVGLLPDEDYLRRERLLAEVDLHLQESRAWQESWEAGRLEREARRMPVRPEDTCPTDGGEGIPTFDRDHGLICVLCGERFVPDGAPCSR